MQPAPALCSLSLSLSLYMSSTPCPQRKKDNVGCMSGIFLFLGIAKYHSKKNLIFRKSRKPSPRSSPATPPPVGVFSGGCKSRRLSCSSLRSPTLPPEIRRPADSPSEILLESPEKKRQKLLGALEQCDADLRTLKKIIDGLRLAETRSPAAVKRLSPGGAAGVEEENGRPSPISVLDALDSPPPRRRRGGTISPSLKCRLSSRGDAAAEIEAGEGIARRSATKESSPAPFSDGWVWEERWEMSRLWVELEKRMLGELVAEMVEELGFRRGEALSSLPFDRCRKRLFF